MILYLEMFFAEKKLPTVNWDLKDNDGNSHFISNDVVIEAIGNASMDEQNDISNMIRRIDYRNGDVNDYLKHLAGGLINS